jgi:hypothetical protein
VSDEHFLSRWSRRKHASKATAEPQAPQPGVDIGSQRPPAAIVAPGEPTPPDPLPPVESLTPESDFTPFMGSEVDPEVKRKALKTLFQDPRFNVMDGLDVYIDDYSKPDPLPEGWLEKMSQVARLGIFRPQEVEGDAQADGGPGQDGLAEPENSEVEQRVAAPAAPSPSDTLVAAETPAEVSKS